MSLSQHSRAWIGPTWGTRRARQVRRFGILRTESRSPRDPRAQCCSSLKSPPIPVTAAPDPFQGCLPSKRQEIRSAGICRHGIWPRHEKRILSGAFGGPSPILIALHKLRRVVAYSAHAISDTGECPNPEQARQNSAAFNDLQHIMTVLSCEFPVARGAGSGTRPPRPSDALG
jgi:hypothetical protein